ncbi:sce7726 family protein [Conyzicola sp.]|uniref:sce7726 family protein n=1 Tax=Conyzicola sp. TaxID=1969404 RepID=UPI003989969B
MDEYGNGVTGAELALAFSPMVMSALGRSSLGVVAPRLSMVAGLVRDRPSATLGEAFDTAHALLAHGYRSEYVFKNALVSKIVYGRHSPATATALVEQQMGNSVADLVVVNGTSTAYEIKTDLDQFVRLDAQLADYCSRAERVYVVTSEARTAAAAARAPSHVGIIGLRSTGSLTTVRAAESNMERLQHDHLFTMLRTVELKSVLRRTHDLVPVTHMIQALEQMRSAFRELDIERAHAETLTQLRGRGTSAAQLTTVGPFPRSLRALAYTGEHSRIGATRIRERLNSPAALFVGVDAA